MESFADRLVELLGVTGDLVPCSWESTEREIGSVVPGDYKELVAHTGSAVLDNWLTIFAPNPSSEVDLASLVKERDWAWEYLREGGVELPEQFFSKERRLIAFAAVDAAYFYWDAKSDVDPEAWGVVIVDGDLQNWYELNSSATECIYKLLLGEVALAPFDSIVRSSEHDVGRFGSQF
jgi:hypothetical protein